MVRGLIRSMFKIVVVLVLCSFLIGYALGRIRPKNLTIFEFLKKMYINLDNFILVISALVVGMSIYLSTIGKLVAFSSTTINIFGSIVFSWLLTKKSSKVEFKEQEEELALRSYRHINYIDTAANTAYKKIEKYLDEGEDLDTDSRLILQSAMDQIKYIQGGISTCKLDWYDMLSVIEKEHYKSSSQFVDQEYGTLDVVVPETEYNQEEV